MHTIGVSVVTHDGVRPRDVRAFEVDATDSTSDLGASLAHLASQITRLWPSTDEANVLK